MRRRRRGQHPLRLLRDRVALPLECPVKCLASDFLLSLGPASFDANRHRRLHTRTSRRVTHFSGARVQRTVFLVLTEKTVGCPISRVLWTGGPDRRTTY